MAKWLNSQERKKQTEEENEEYIELYSQSQKISGRDRGTFTICDIHRKIYKMIVDESDKIETEEHQEELKYLLQRAFVIAKKTDAKLRQYKHNYDDNWYQDEKKKHSQWIEELKDSKK